MGALTIGGSKFKFLSCTYQEHNGYKCDVVTTKEGSAPPNRAGFYDKRDPRNTNQLVKVHNVLIKDIPIPRGSFTLYPSSVHLCNLSQVKDDLGGKREKNFNLICKLANT